jgi:hypothetical protein
VTADCMALQVLNQKAGARVYSTGYRGVVDVSHEVSTLRKITSTFTVNVR